MPYTLWVVLLSIAFLESGIVIGINLYIVITNFRSFKSKLTLNPSHVIYLAMGLVNIVLQCSLTTQGSLYVICVQILFIKEIYLPLTIAILAMIYCSFWLTAWLCAHYCSSIANFRFGLCLWLKRMNSSTQLLLLLLLLAGSFLLSLLSIWTTTTDVTEQLYENSTLGGSFIKGTFHFNQLYVIIVSIPGYILPLFLILISVILTLFSLSRHMCQVKQNDSGFPCSKLQAHVNAIRTIILILVTFIIFCTAEIVIFTNEIRSSDDSIFLISWSLVLLYPGMETLIVIQANSKLRKELRGTLQFLCLKYLKTGN